MKHFNLLRRSVFRFRRFSRKNYAAFSSMHRVVNIGHLASYIASRKLKKSIALVVFGIPVLSGMALAQTDDPQEERLLPSLVVVATADTQQCSPDAVAYISKSQLEGLPISSVGELLKQLPGLDLRTRGGGDVQGDLSMRGGTFDQMIVLLNGVNLNDAQTGHHNLDIPIDLSLVDRVEIIPASNLIHFGLTSLCGAVNIVTTENQNNKVHLALSAGSFNQVHLVGGLSQKVGGWTLSASASHHRSEGYQLNTDFQYSNVFLQAYRHTRPSDWTIQVGGQLKDFGSQAFYSLRYPYQFESTRTLLASVSYQRRWHLWELDATLYGRLHKDRFELFRQGFSDVPSWYTGHNYHLSQNYGLRLRASRKIGIGKASIGTELRDEGILSNVLGDSLTVPKPIRGESPDCFYSVGMDRMTVNLFSEYSAVLRKCRLAVSLLESYNSRMGLNHGYAVAADYYVNKEIKLNGSFGRSMRLPTYTDLYYHAANQVGNPYLLPEIGYNAEANLWYNKGHFSSLTTAFLRHSLDIIDWVRYPNEDIWYSVNHARVNALGFAVQAAYHTDGILNRLGMSYSYCTLFQQEDGFISAYVLDYLKNNLSVDVVLSVGKNLNIKLMGTYHDRVGKYTYAEGVTCNYDPVLLLNSGVEYSLRFATIFADFYNLLNRQYCDYGGVTQPGFSFLVGIRFNCEH